MTFPMRPRSWHWLQAVFIGVISAALVVSSANAQNKTEFPGGDTDIRIVGGERSSEDYEFMAALLYRLPDGSVAQGCGGSLINERWLVTAAHCVIDNERAKLEFVRLGSTNRHTGGEIVALDWQIRHPEYNSVTLRNDIALIRLERPVSHAPIAIAPSRPPVGTDTRLLGWGQTCAPFGCDNGSETLRELDTTVVNNWRCSNIGSKDLCIDSSTSATVCRGDSGGPALARSGAAWVLIGATSRGSNPCGSSNTIYTSVPDYESWIRALAG